MVGVWLLVWPRLAALMIRFAFSIWVFWTERSWALSRMYYQFFQFATKPDTIYLYPPSATRNPDRAAICLRRQRAGAGATAWTSEPR